MTKKDIFINFTHNPCEILR